MRCFTFVLLLAALILAGSNISGAETIEKTELTFLLSNEAPGRLIDHLISIGYGNSSLHRALEVLRKASGGAIRQSFLDTLAANTNSDVMKRMLNDFNGMDNSIGINSDGSILITKIFGKDYYKKQNYTTFRGAINPMQLRRFTTADNSDAYIDAGTATKTDGQGNQIITTYKAYAIAWAIEPPTSIILSNEGGLIDSLIAAGEGNTSLYDVITKLRKSSGEVISDDFVFLLSRAPLQSITKTEKLIVSQGLKGALAIHSDGSRHTVQIRGKDFLDLPGYGNYQSTGLEKYSYAEEPESYIDVSTTEKTYKAGVIIWNGLSTGVTEAEEEKILVYPNPFSDGIYISNLEAPACLEIFDILGRNVYCSTIEGKEFIPLPSLQDGIYWVKLRKGEEEYRQVLIKI